MYPPVPTNDPTAVEVEVQAAYLAMFPQADRLVVPQLFGWAIECFTGRYGDYQAVDARYHDFEHTLQGTLCLVRLLRARHATGVLPLATERMFRLAIVAILFHDTGYLKKRYDMSGTGAKYTITHVSRSADLAEEFLKQKGFPIEDIRAVQNMIRCTGVTAILSSIPFKDGLERIFGAAIATADILGQMAAEDYVQKLPVLYSEFEEAVKFSGDKEHFISSFGSADELLKRTPSFWQDFARARLEKECGGLYRFLNSPYPDGPNEYIERISRNIQQLKAELQLAGKEAADASG